MEYDIKTAEVIDYDKEWEKTFRTEAKKIKKALGKNCASVHHIRDTAFKSEICAVNGKVRIAIIVAVKDTSDLDPGMLSGIGYKRAETAEYEYEKEGNADIVIMIRELQINSELIASETSLRDYMISHPEKAKEYAAHAVKCARESADAMAAISESEKFLTDLRPEISKWQEEQHNISMGLSLGMCFGMSIGMAIGTAMGNTTLGMTMGMSIGMCIGIALGSAKNKK